MSIVKQNAIYSEFLPAVSNNQIKRTLHRKSFPKEKIYMSRANETNSSGDTYVSRRTRTNAPTSYSLTKPVSLYETPANMRRTFSSCKIIQSKDAKKSLILEYIKDYCVYRLQLTPDKEYIPTPTTLVNSCWNTLDDARDSFSATICISIFKKDAKEHKRMQKSFKNVEAPARYRLRLQKFLKGPMEAALSHVRLTKLSDLEKTKIFRNMLERVFQENEMKAENMYEDVDMTYRSKAEGDVASRKQHYYQMTLNEVFSIRKLEKLFILIARHCCFYACIKMDFMVKSIMSEAADFLVESLIFDWMMNKLGGMKGWSQVYEMEREIAAGRAQPPSKMKNANRATNDKTRKKTQKTALKPQYGQILECDERGDTSRLSNQLSRASPTGTIYVKRTMNQKNVGDHEPDKKKGCACIIM